MHLQRTFDSLLLKRDDFQIAWFIDLLQCATNILYALVNFTQGGRYGRRANSATKEKAGWSPTARCCCRCFGRSPRRFDRHRQRHLVLEQSASEAHLFRFLAVPHEINESNAAAISLIDLNLLGLQGLEALLLSQIRIFETISSIYAGSLEGGLVNAGREGTGDLYYVIDTEGFRSGAFNKYRVDDEGNRGELLLTIPGFDARTRPWFKAAVEKQDATWSDIYVLFSGQDMAVAASRPVYDGQGNLLMVLSSDIFLSQIDDFMRSLEYGKTGLGFIIERSGLIVACSDDHPHLTMDEDTNTFHRMQATESAAPLIRYTALFLEEPIKENTPLTVSSCSFR